MPPREILGLCAREQGHAAMRDRLAAALDGFTDWEALISLAERHSMAPLLHRHLNEAGVVPPLEHRRSLQALALRHRHADTVRREALKEILTAFQRAGMPILLFKGAALARMAYSDGGLRPMRDLDILVRGADAPEAENLLKAIGYQPEVRFDIPDGHYHLVPLRKKLGGLHVHVEPHHNLLPFLPGYPLWPLDALIDTTQVFEIDGIPAKTLGREDLLWHVYLHGFAMPLTYEPFRFIHAADMVTLVEKELETMDWAHLRAERPRLLNALGALHHLSPWPGHVLEKLGIPLGRKPGGLGRPYEGWPRRHLRELGKESRLALLKATLLPPAWWLRMHYGAGPGFALFRALLWEHPRAVFWWLRLYWPHFRSTRFPRLPPCRRKH